MRKWFYIVLIVFAGFGFINNDVKELNLNSFKITIPKSWIYLKEQGDDSFVGGIKISGRDGLSFDCSNNGYANDLIPTEQSYLTKGTWKMGRSFFYKVGVTYTANFNVHNERLRQMKEKGITDSSLVNVEADPSYETVEKLYRPTAEQKLKFPKADYIADLTYRKSTIIVPIEIPAETKAHYIKIDSTEKYVTKTIWPKVAGKGMTGVYIHSRNSRFNFQMSGNNLSITDQALALQAFKTIKFKTK